MGAISAFESGSWNLPLDLSLPISQVSFTAQVLGRAASIRPHFLTSIHSSSHSNLASSLRRNSSHSGLTYPPCHQMGFISNINLTHQEHSTVDHSLVPEHSFLVFLLTFWLLLLSLLSLLIHFIHSFIPHYKDFLSTYMAVLFQMLRDKIHPFMGFTVQ